MSADVVVKVTNLEKRFPNGFLALDGVSTDVKKNEVVVVIGPSGSGKSTFLRCLNLLEMPTGGSIEVNGVDITNPKADINMHRRKMGMVFQQFNLFPHKTVLENMTLAPIKLLKKSKAEAEAEAVSRLLYLAQAAGEAPVYIVHLSTRRGLEEFRKAKAAGQAHIGAETCPHSTE